MAQAPENADLGVVNVSIDKAREQDSAAQVADRRLRRLLRRARGLSAGGDTTFGEQQRAILMGYERARRTEGIARRVKQRGAQNLKFGRRAHDCAAPTAEETGSAAAP